ncbi:MAG: Transcriptional regulator, PadR family, partial [uncultured Rubrobacteraceae bacterium]
DQQGLDSRVLDPDRPGDPGRRGQLRLRHPQASSGAVRRAYGVDGRDALPCSASARASRPRRIAVGSCGERPPSQVLPDHVSGPGSARRGTQAVAGSGRDAAGHLAGAPHSPPGKPPGVSRATSTGGL